MRDFLIGLFNKKKKELKEVPQELSKQEEVEVEKTEVVLEEVKEIIHSPENEVEKKAHISMGDFARMSPQERIQAKLNN